MARPICISVLIALLLCIGVVHCLDEDLLDESRDEDTLLAAFDLAHIRRVKDESAKLVPIGTDLEVTQKIGLLALYFRLFKKFVPAVHKQGLKHLFPEPTVDFDPDLAGECKEGLVKCINALHGFYSKTHPWLFEKSSSNGNTIFKGKGFFQQVINDNQLSFETTAMQVIFLTS
ncbi:hypothetical protein WR25_00909 [Diploscapter pachys]|uniref:Uncharacterized protein n=1 Tax=Diploscapter pachys TaxID=2018661 RepID=A0A2A2KVP1_9BILA|nr:hypothetical protein WR25_00909 [Diploscapter pachys]